MNRIKVSLLKLGIITKFLGTFSKCQSVHIAEKHYHAILHGQCQKQMVVAYELCNLNITILSLVIVERMLFCLDVIQSNFNNYTFL